MRPPESAAGQASPEAASRGKTKHEANPPDSGMFEEHFCLDTAQGLMSSKGSTAQAVRVLQAELNLQQSAWGHAASNL